MRIALVSFIAVLASCVSISKYTQQPFVVGWEDDLRERASFELHCDAAAFKVTKLGADGNMAGVEGCDQKGVYVRSVGNGGVWILNSDDKGAGK
jgi:hypothetical protein